MGIQIPLPEDTEAVESLVGDVQNCPFSLTLSKTFEDGTQTLRLALTLLGGPMKDKLGWWLDNLRPFYPPHLLWTTFPSIPRASGALAGPYIFETKVTAGMMESDKDRRTIQRALISLCEEIGPIFYEIDPRIGAENPSPLPLLDAEQDLTAEFGKPCAFCGAITVAPGVVWGGWNLGVVHEHCYAER